MDADAIVKPGAALGRRRGFLSVHHESGPLDLQIRGTLPDWLQVSYLLNGPAQWELPRASYSHWFDGLAMLHRFEIGSAGVRYHNRFLRSQDARESHAAGRPELGGYDTPAAGGLLSRILHMFNPRRTDNACVVISSCDGQWLATTESDRAMRFDSRTLETLGEFEWSDTEKMPLMAAHPCIDANGRWWNVGAKLGRTCEYVLFTCDRNARREVKARIPVARAGYLHAFAMSATHAVIWDCAWRAHPLRFLFAGESYARHFDWMPEQGSRLHTVRLSDGAVRTWEAPPLVLFHAAQAYDNGADVIVDLCLDDAPVIEDLHISRLRRGEAVSATRARHTRFVLSPGASAARQEALPGRFDLPQVNAQRAATGPVRYVWAAAVSDDTPGEFFNRTIKLDHHTGTIRSAGNDEMLSLEPLFVGRPGASAEDDGVLLINTLAENDAGTRIRVLDASSLEQRAAIEVPHVIPFGFHGGWEALGR